MKKIILLLALVSFHFSNSQLITQDNFSAYTTGVQLSGQGVWTNNSSLPGGAGAATAGGFNTKVITTASAYLDYGTSANSIEVKPNSDACGFPFTAVTSGDLYVGFVLNLSAAQANSNSDFFRILSGSNFNTSARLYATPSTPFDFFIGVAKGANGNPIAFSPVAFSFQDDHLVIIKYSQLAGTNDDSVSIYIDPVFANGVPATPTIMTTSGADQSGSIDRLFVRQNWTNGMPTGKLGLVSVSTTWAGLAFPNLATNSVTTTNFKVIANNSKTGILAINSNSNFENAKVTIFDIQGKVIETKIVSLTENMNEISINPIQNSGVYIVEIIANDKQFTQKISVN